MSDKWRNRLLYWLLATVPLACFCLASKMIGSGWFTVFLLLYILTYRPAIDAQRLMSLGAIEEKDAWRFFIPLAVDRIPYTKKLWWG
jgi:hypothetical protein